MNQYLLGIDIGTSACKVTVFDKEGHVMAKANGTYPVYYPKPGWAEQNPKEWWQAICKTVRAMFSENMIKPKEICGVGIDGQSWSAIPVDENGEVLANTPIWMDIRAQDICNKLEERVGSDEIFALTGNPLRPSYTTAKILWYKQNLPDVYARTYKILQSNSYIVMKLTGVMSHDISQGYGLHCFDIRTGTWNEAMCEKLGIPMKFLPDIYPCHQVVGTVTKKASEECGLSVGTPVVAGGLDAACGTLGAGVIHPGETQEQGGQAGGMSICMDTCKADTRLIIGYHVVPGKWLLQGGTTGGGGVMRWLEQELSSQDRDTLPWFNELAENISPGSDGLVFLPYMAGERSPIWDTKAKGVYFGLDFGKTRGHLIRAAMEGVAFSLRHNLETAHKAGVDVSVLRAVGGSANSLLWTQIKSDITGKPIVVTSSDTATALGAAILAGVGVGLYESFEKAVKLAVKEKRFYEPDQTNKYVYDRNYKIYLKLYQQLKDIMHDTK